MSLYVPSCDGDVRTAYGQVLTHVSLLALHKLHVRVQIAVGSDVGRF
jgi:hypothetical protein